MPIIRLLSIVLIVYLVARSFMLHEISTAQNDNRENETDKIKSGGKKISKGIGEYIDYEEVDEENLKEV